MLPTADEGVIEEFTWSTESDLTTQKHRALSARHSQAVLDMAKEKFGIAVDEEIV